MHTEVNREIIGFSWESILTNSQEFEQNPCNPTIFDIKWMASIATHKNEIVAIHPFNRETLNKVSKKLSVAVTQYYKENASVTITEESIIRVCFLEDTKKSFLLKLINKFNIRNK